MSEPPKHESARGTGKLVGESSDRDDSEACRWPKGDCRIARELSASGKKRISVDDLAKAASHGAAPEGLDELLTLLREPHNLGFAVSGKTGTYDRQSILVDRDWHERLGRLVARLAPQGGGYR